VDIAIGNIAILHSSGPAILLEIGVLLLTLDLFIRGGVVLDSVDEHYDHKHPEQCPAALCTANKQISTKHENVRKNK